ncbi:hypothetical protein J6590_014808 [Homalodisca vitripennis]|nr:hypothetical protein J6590_014808 [Homalodisca vitripennis]
MMYVTSYIIPCVRTMYTFLMNYDTREQHKRREEPAHSTCDERRRYPRHKDKYNCVHCGKGFRHKTSFTLHVRFECGQLQLQCPSSSSTPRTEEESFGKERFECTRCGRSYKYEKSLPLHLRFECGQKDCPSSVRVPDGEIDHVIRTELTETHECPSCGMKFQSDKSLGSHLRFECTQAEFPSYSAIASDEEVLEEIKERFRCGECGRSYKYEKSLLLHHKFECCNFQKLPTSASTPNSS